MSKLTFLIFGIAELLQRQVLVNMVNPALALVALKSTTFWFPLMPSFLASDADLEEEGLFLISGFLPFLFAHGLLLVDEVVRGVQKILDPLHRQWGHSVVLSVLLSELPFLVKGSSGDCHFHCRLVGIFVSGAKGQAGGRHDPQLSFGDAESFDPLTLVPSHQRGEVEELIRVFAHHQASQAFTESTWTLTGTLRST